MKPITIDTDAGEAVIDPAHVVAITRGTGRDMSDGAFVHLSSGLSIFARDTSVALMTMIIEENV